MDRLEAAAEVTGPVERLASFSARFDRPIRLRDGTDARLRPIRADDAPRLIALYDRLSQDTRYQRFFTAMRRLPTDWARFFADVDYVTRLALVVQSPNDANALIAVARYEPTDEPGTAEVAFVVEDRWQSQGLGTVLFTELLAAAAFNGITRFRAWVLSENRRMLALIAHFGDVTARSVERGVVELTFTARP